MNIPIIAAIVVVFASVILSQKIAINAAAKLDDGIKLRIAEVFPKRNMNYTMIIFGLVIVFLLAMYIWPQYLIFISICYAATFFVYIFAKLILNVRKLVEIGAPAEYIRSVKVSFGVFIGGAVGACIVFAMARAGFGI